MSGNGTVSPPDIAAIGTALNPVTARFQGTQGADGVVTDFSLTQVTSCTAAPQPAAGSLPSTATGVGPGRPIAGAPAAVEPPPPRVVLAFAGLVLLLVLLAAAGLGPARIVLRR